MCGIAGMYGEADRGTVEDMVQCLEHRGPDGDGFYEDDGIAMGMRRLAIIDPEGGDQPIHNEDETVWVVFNGEIYNYPELREELEDEGHAFYTDADTEVLVHLYEEHGSGFVERLNGMFAFALWDAEDEQLLLARDRLGIKPLYYTEHEGSVRFGSEPSALQQGSRRQEYEVDQEAITTYLGLGYIPAPRSGFDGIRKLQPGTYLKIDDEELSTTRYWNLPPTAESKASNRAEEFYVDRLRTLLRDSVEKRMLADVPVGAFLSGGIDSSTIVALMAEMRDDPVRTYTVSFTDIEHDESGHARTVADHVGADHTEYTVRLGDSGTALDTLQELGEPVADPAIVPTRLIAGQASADVKVVNTGSGADELFAGYGRYRKYRGDYSRFRYIPDAVKRGVYAAERLFPRYSKPWYYATYLGSMTSQPEHYAEMLTREYDLGLESRQEVERLAQSAFDSDDYLDNMTAFDIRYLLPGDLLFKVDRASMMHGLEARVPFLDYRLVEFSRRIPSRQKVTGGSTKHLLKQAASELLPSDIVHRDKHGFTVPIESWMTDADSALSRRFDRQRFADVPGLEADEVMRQHKQLERGHQEHAQPLWRALTLQVWYESVMTP